MNVETMRPFQCNDLVVNAAEGERGGYDKTTLGSFIFTAHYTPADGDCMFHAIFPGKDPEKIRRQFCGYLRLFTLPILVVD